MCGIFGIVGEKAKSYTDESLKSALASLSKRGPDDKGTLKFPHCVLGQTRLSIVDISGGHQPMQDNQKNIAITFNGEIYNYKELKKDLENKEHKFSTNSDTEVILKSYIEYGHKCLDYFDGMFAFAIWDEDAQSLFMARDRFGKKPFYYAFDEEKNFIFASEIKTIFASGKIKGILDRGAITDYLSLMYIPPNKTVYKNIFTLGPAEYAAYQNGLLTKQKYWELTYAPLSVSYNDAKEKVRYLFTEAVKKRLVADVEIGSFLSGGVDSTLVTAYAQKYSSHPLKTFSLGYGEHINELPHAKEAAQKIGTEHYALQADETLIETFKQSIAYFDEPHADSSDFPQSLLSTLASGKVKIALSGDGADELFMGYGWYTRHQHLSFKAHTFEKLFLNPFQGYIRNISIFGKYAIPPELAGSKLNPILKINQFDLTIYLPGQLMTKVDRMGMMHSLEVRSPFLDHQLAEFVFNLPQEYRMGKKILKDLLGEIMPPAFVNKKKQGFGAPVQKWLREPTFKKLTRESLLSSNAEIYQYLGKKEINAIIEKFYEKKDDSYYYKIWVLLCLELWLQSHK